MPPVALGKSVQLAGVKVNVPVGALLLQLTVPVGVLLVPLGSVSLTVAVQVVGLPAWNELGVQLTLVLVARVVAVTAVLPLLVACLVSPP
jgi:hypothetical protein